ncbi:MAG: DUF983 domain-containing protein [Planctomycetota bacterium]
MELAELRRRALLRGARLRCPQCGARGLHVGFGRLRERCPACELVLRREQGAQTGSMYLTAALSQVLAAALVFLIWFGTDWSVATSLAVALPLVLVACAFVLPFAQCLWIAIEYVTDAVNREPWVRPR